ncbi:hypothetical protein EYF80_021279 [Liparis tanakae]|uniref:Uncharacterized protein n=1 Tax=Liparis tanakae TaxID=230148 RepID=A0A4Z2HU16_9TELE|nr:hypothetical protein EYF80_021279 [Liparis tanakae]
MLAFFLMLEKSPPLKSFLKGDMACELKAHKAENLLEANFTGILGFLLRCFFLNSRDFVVLLLGRAAGWVREVSAGRFIRSDQLRLTAGQWQASRSFVCPGQGRGNQSLPTELLI